MPGKKRGKKFKILQMFLEYDYLPNEEMMPNFMDMNNKEMVFRLYMYYISFCRSRLELHIAFFGIVDIYNTDFHI